QDDTQPAGEERRLAQTRLQRLGVELDLLEDLCIGEERDDRAGVVLLGLADNLHVTARNTARELLAVDLPIAMHLGDEPFRQRIDDRDADAVKSARNLVCRVFASELSTCAALRP